MKPNPQQTQRISGLDTLRFIAALWVVFGHCGYFPLTEGLDRTNRVALVVQGIYGNLFAAVPAVIVFFVISGFCIHYPYRKARSFEILPYLVRRYLRIGIPLLAAVFLARPFHVKLTLFHNSILWSLLAELLYYSLYPALMRLKRRFGWDTMIVVSFVLGYAAILIHPAAQDYSPYGPGLSWLVALPCWLLGCRLAESDFTLKGQATQRFRLWQWRLGIWFLSWLASVLRFHSPVGYPWTLNLFSIPVFFWLLAEIVAFRARPASRFLEWAGKWSYSIYLMHMIANEAFNLLPLPNFGSSLNWVIRIVFVLSFAYAFYLLVEYPGHLLAREASRLVQRKAAGPAPITAGPAALPGQPAKAASEITSKSV